MNKFITALLMALSFNNIYCDYNELLKKPIDKLTTDESIILYKHKKDIKYLNNVNNKYLLNYSKKGCFIPQKDQIYKIAHSFSLKDRLYIGNLPNNNEYILEPIIIESNFYYEEEGGQYLYPYSFDIDDNDNIWLSLKQKGLDKYNNQGKYIETIFPNGRFVTCDFIKIDISNSTLICNVGDGIEIDSFKTTNSSEISGLKAKDLYNQYVINDQKDDSDNSYNYNNNLILLNGVPIILDPSPPIRSGSIDDNARRFVVVPNGDIYFRWCLGKSITLNNHNHIYKSDIFILFKLRKLL